MGVFISQTKKRIQPAKELIRDYPSFGKGLNTFLLDNELRPDELVDATNMRLVGKGILEPRGGTAFSYQADTNATVRYLVDFYLNNQVTTMAITDQGFLTKQSNSSYTRILGASFASGARPEGVQVYGRLYLVDGNRPLTRYDGTTLLTYTKISSPTSLTATKSSGTTGSFQFSYRVAHESDVGQTLASDPVTLANLPENLAVSNFVTLSWVKGSPVSYIKGTIIFGRESGAESYMTRVPADVTTWIDDGTSDPSLSVFPFASNTTDGPIAKHITKYKEKIILGNISTDKSAFLWSGSGPYIDNFHYSKGGGYYSIEQDSDDRWGITGIAEKEGKITLFKGLSIFQAVLTFNASLGINEATISKLVDGVGCISGKTILPVENSIMFVAYVPGRGLALAKLDYEPNILSSVLRFQPISARVQSIIDQTNFERIEETWAVYFDKKYHWFLPIGASSWTCLVYDVERLAFVGPWTLTDAWCGIPHLDSQNKYHLLLGKSTGNVVELSDQYADDEGTNFTWRAKTKKDDFDRPFQLKTVIDAKTKLRNISGGNVNISYITEGDTGIVSSAKSVSAAPQTTLAGWGSRAFSHGANNRFGYQPSTSSSNSNDIVKYTQLNKPNVLAIQTEISGTGSKAQIIAVEIRAREQSRSLIPASWR